VGEAARGAGAGAPRRVTIRATAPVLPGASVVIAGAGAALGACDPRLTLRRPAADGPWPSAFSIQAGARLASKAACGSWAALPGLRLLGAGGRRRE
jgi:hypothetical protein